jgi:hypothetical protein
MTIGRFRAAPQQGHLSLEKYPDTASICFFTEIPDHFELEHVTKGPTLYCIPTKILGPPQKLNFLSQWYNQPKVFYQIYLVGAYTGLFVTITLEFLDKVWNLGK